MLRCNNYTKEICALGLVLLLSFNTTRSYASGYKITLKNGKEIETRYYSEQDDRIYFEQFGSMVAIAKDGILKIKPNDTSDSKDQEADANKRQKHLRLPLYYRVTGAKNKEFNGLYEESGAHNNQRVFRQVSGRYMLFSHNSSIQSGPPVWALGELGHGSSHVFFINQVIRGGEFPENEGGWTSSNGEILYPEMSVKKNPPPQTVYSGNNAYVVNDFPIEECNGEYRPETISNGYVSYVHTARLYKLHYSAGAWMISYCPGKNCFQQFWTKRLSSETMPHEIDQWYDIRNTRVVGSVSVYSHPTTALPAN